MLGGKRKAGQLAGEPGTVQPGKAVRDLVASLRGMRIGRIGEAPGGFDTCLYDRQKIMELAGVEVSEMPLNQLFDTARADDRAAPRQALHNEIAAYTAGLDSVDPVQLQRSLDLKLALDEIRAEGKFDAFAIRCWPETFTEYGGAVCGPVSLMGEARIPCACEADVYGALTQILLQGIADAPAFLTDLVDLDAEDDTGVVWHCGQAPASMRTGEATATIHSNRKMPLLFEFALKPGRVTFARISQAANRQQMVIASGQMLDRPKSFTGTSGVVRFDTPAGEVARKIMASGLEHHMALAYGDHRAALREAAAALHLPVLEL
jgi:L-fucose isomerase-like protein